jgi:hypothetical protein
MPNSMARAPTTQSFVAIGSRRRTQDFWKEAGRKPIGPAASLAGAEGPPSTHLGHSASHSGMALPAPFASFETTPLNRRVGGGLPFPICPLSDAHYSKAVIYRVKRGITRRRHSPRCCQRTR